MAGKKGRSGGKREGAGRKAIPPETSYDDQPFDFDEDKQTELDGKTELKEGQVAVKKDEFQDFLDYRVTCEMRNLTCPKMIASIPYAKQAWDYVLQLDENSSLHLLNERHFECIKSYCLACAIRDGLVNSWASIGSPMTFIDDSGNSLAKPHPLLREIKASNAEVNKYATELGLTVMSELKLPKAPKKNNDGGMFD